MNKGIHFVPLVSSPAGSCLTSANWYEVGVRKIAYDFASLLMKPGPVGIEACLSLAHYLAWDGEVILDASMVNFNHEGVYHLRSSYDGSRHQFTLQQCIDWISHLKPTAVVVGDELLRSGLAMTKIALSSKEGAARISDKPANQAFHGELYTQQGTISIYSEEYARDFGFIDDSCDCPTCQQKLTRAYFHHLFKHTPLLCQRFLIMHNIYVIEKSRYDVSF